MLRKIGPAVAVCSLALAATTSVAAAAPPAGAGAGGKPAGIACQQAGISTLQSLGLLSAVAEGGIEVVGVGTVPFTDVLALHRTMPELFQTGGVTVVVPGVGEVVATWCDA
jgi:hypothetical protein